MSHTVPKLVIDMSHRSKWHPLYFLKYQSKNQSKSTRVTTFRKKTPFSGDWKWSHSQGTWLL